MSCPPSHNDDGHDCHDDSDIGGVMVGRQLSHHDDGHDRQSQKNPVSASAMLTRKFLRIGKVFVTCSVLSEEFLENLENVRMLHKIPR